MAADEQRLTAGRAWARFTRSVGRGIPTKMAEVHRLARKTRALPGRRKGKRG